MKKLYILLAAVLLCVLAPEAKAQGTSMGACAYSPGALKSAYKEMITVSTAALPFTAATYRPASTSGQPAAVCALVTVNTNSISWWTTGATPTSSDGIISASGVSFWVGASDLARFLMIRAGASDAAVAVVYFTPIS